MDIGIFNIVLTITGLIFGVIFGFVSKSIGEQKGKDNCFWRGFFLGII